MKTPKIEFIICSQCQDKVGYFTKQIGIVRNLYEKYLEYQNSLDNYCIDCFVEQLKKGLEK